MLGGLIPIKSRFILDLGTIICITNCVLVPGSPTYFHTVLLIIPCVVTFFTAGLLDRWTISLPFAPIFVLQCSRYFHFVSPISWAALTIKIMSLSMVILATLLSILFPAVQLGEVKGKYNIGVIDLQLPVKGFEREHVSARILYPCSKNDEDVASVSYLIEETNDQLCAAMMRTAAPPPLRGLDFMLNVWKFAKLPLIRNGKPLDGLNSDTEEQVEGVQGEEQIQKKNGESGKIPMAIYSHGLTGTAVIYSYQTMNLAANGTVVLAIDHTDGSAMGVQHVDGSFHTFDESIGALSLRGKMLEYILARRKQTDYRTREFLAAAESFLELNKKNIRELEDAGISFVGKLKTDDLSAMGHSFGAATALTACGRKSEMFSCCISHDPAIDWVPDDVRRELFNTERVKETEMKYNGGTCGFESGSKKDSPEKKKPGPFYLFGKVVSDETNNSSVHDLDHFFLYSNEFMDKGWGEFKLIAELSRLDLLGLKSRYSEVGYVYKAHHSEFSDSCSTLPLWLARAVGMTGPRNPIETGEEIAHRTLHFVETIRRERMLKRKAE